MELVYIRVWFECGNVLFRSDSSRRGRCHEVRRVEIPYSYKNTKLSFLQLVYFVGQRIRAFAAGCMSHVTFRQQC